ncbi:hypothetical protein A3A46_04325 [Candidatus Roizmanbacteria bacterium RIFCSPLOWO2_01_FULL_37_13]|uniref:Uncharacterized protein n=1 Tax=Candidatus Roizmanbacteria bacterium RIFCSPHIGHO2_02_FULL_38_11 TaxID=1802039 RepID=A0A1F7H1G2_9BACT|nr:MAG: hypothetical protein A3C25_03110 [Candidatus Roizmanbacteria bacterium RIFCSPHIGHO2_02_FULL_38_11]OGK41001.1 MAG: hypothetical protein A3A46_04325 [Candidatus Roizmanbacteria bacterium RIFCSPLOWO2_01_FULL_37_13]
MKKTNPQSLQIKLALDEGLKKTWLQLKQEYQALDKASIVRLALNNLAKRSTTKEYKKYLDNSLDEILREIESREDGMTEREFFEWWNKNKPFTK